MPLVFLFIIDISLPINQVAFSIGFKVLEEIQEDDQSDVDRETPKESKLSKASKGRVKISES